MIIEYLKKEEIWLAHGSIVDVAKDKSYPIIVEHPDKLEAFHGWVELASNKMKLEAAK